ncbi:probable E3 ubiquitin-protein ligase RHB1A [Corylus avellana]|uniref:probable E3 ubiquitin-protein ligase RHB1A n=1 Tax=Corylus avellana TaxID=13451 RepID=UPI00286C830D|nr:probable E3 ubiquitin-protein ligase RHB1A [Corylus avellana]XP_059459104.1 probable E3 ubiquitin-protein ligase RHB1A [Corylus avellana]
MGGCCCSSRKAHLHGTPVYYYCPPALGEHEPLASHNGAASAFTAEFLFDWGLDVSTPDTFRPPPTPLPYDLVLGCTQSTDSESARETINGSSFGTLTTCEDLEESDCKAQANSLSVSPRKLEIPNLNEHNVSAAEEEDVCPICLEEYDAENPSLITRCEHHFHLSCILEWMERSDACPICDQEMTFDITRT